MAPICSSLLFLTIMNWNAHARAQANQELRLRLAAVLWVQAPPSAIAQQENNSSNDTDTASSDQAYPWPLPPVPKMNRCLPVGLCGMTLLSAVVLSYISCLWPCYHGYYLQIKSCPTTRQKTPFINSYIHLWGTPDSHFYWVSSTTNLESYFLFLKH